MGDAGPVAARVSVELVAPGIFVWRDDDHVETFHCARDGEVVHLFWRGTAYRFEADGESSRSAHRLTRGWVSAL